MAVSRVGRPRGFDQEAALRHAVDIFWEQGYAATSLDALLAAMGIARSSFYATFGSKHAVLLAALELYTAELFARMQAAAAARADDPRAALRAVMEIAACSARPAIGCLFANTVSELAPADAQVRRLSISYLGKVRRLLTRLLVQLAGEGARTDCTGTSTALMAMASGAVTLRKAGQSEAQVAQVLQLADLLVDQLAPRQAQAGA